MECRAAVDQAVDFCIGEGVLADFLKRHRTEVTEMILTEYNEELHIRNEKALSYQEGIEQGRLQEAGKLNALNNRLIRDKRFDELKRSTEDPDLQKKLLEEYGIE